MNFSGKIENFFAVRKRRKLLAEYKSLRHAEDDLLGDEQKRDFDALIDELAHSDAPPEKAMAAARESFGRLELGIRHPALREILDLLLVVGAVAAGIRGLFLQPFRIPTGSMQPTLYGIHYQYKDGSWRDQLPPLLQAVLFGRRRAELTVLEEGYLDPDSLRTRDGALTIDTSFRIGSRTYTLPGDAKKVAEYLEAVDRIGELNVYSRGEKAADGYVTTGDHLFVERCSLYLDPPKRGDVMVFNTENLAVRVDGSDKPVPLSKFSGYYYIKRIVGLPGDTLKIEDGTLYIKPEGETKFRRADELDPRFKKIFSGKGGYSGYGAFAPAAGVPGAPRPRFLLKDGENKEYTVPKRHYFMLGDNTDFSMDGRYFGPVPRRNLVGRALFVFWPCSRRWGVADSKTPLDIPTERDGRNVGSHRVMYRQ